MTDNHPLKFQENPRKIPKILINENTYELIENLENFSNIAASPSFDYSLSSEIQESFLILQPTNSILSVIPDSEQLVSVIKLKNSELQQNCTEKLNELRNTTKEFCAANSGYTGKKTLTEDSTDERFEAKSKNFNNLALEKIICDLASIKGDLSKVSERLENTQRELTSENDEHLNLISKMRRIAEEKEMRKNMQVVCNCILC